MKQRLYLDTSVFGGYFDKEFSEQTIPLFNRIKNGEFILLYSAITQDELENAPQNVKELPATIDSNYREFLTPKFLEIRSPREFAYYEDT